jgi:hypothetical protein
MNARVLMRVAAAVGGLILSATVGHATEVKVFTSVALKTVLNEVSPIFEQKTGHKLVIDFNLAAVQKKTPPRWRPRRCDHPDAVDDGGPCEAEQAGPW